MRWVALPTLQDTIDERCIEMPGIRNNKHSPFAPWIQQNLGCADTRSTSTNGGRAWEK